MNHKILYLGLATLTASLLLEFMPNSSWAAQGNTTTPADSFKYEIAQVRTYQVKLGDTLSGIAAKTGVDLQQILSYNSGLRSNPHLIRVGQIIYLSQPAKPNIETVKPVRRKTVQTFKLPSQRREGSNRIGGRRGDSRQDCRANLDDSLRVLLPNTNFGYTLQDYPTFFWYMPQLKTEPYKLELRMRTEGVDTKIYELDSHNQTSGIMSLTLPTDMGPLTEGKEYQWEIRLYCTPQTFFFASGNVQRLSTDNTLLANQLEQAPIEDYPAILAEHGIWYDALAILSALKQENPSDNTLANDWVNILKMIDFDNLASAPLFAQ